MIKGKIYKLICEDLTYYGSTTKKYLSSRLSHHKYCWKNNSGLFTSKLLFDKGEVKIYLVEEFECENKKELHERERYYIENYECVNKYIPTRTQKEYKKYYSKTPQRKKYINDYNAERVKCSVCNKELNKSSLKRHIKTKHS